MGVRELVFQEIHTCQVVINSYKLSNLEFKLGFDLIKQMLKKQDPTTLLDNYIRELETMETCMFYNYLTIMVKTQNNN